MNFTSAISGRPAVASRHLSSEAAFVLLASITVSFLAGSSAPTPLYPTYMAEWGLSPLAITIIFGIYAIAVLSALLVAGRLSDHVGRRPVLIGAALTQALSMGLLAVADGATELITARVLQGLAAGAALAAVGAGMLDLDKARGATANAVAPPFGTATGSLIGGLFVQYLPAPTQLIYLILAGVFLAQAVLLSFMRETISPQAGALRSLLPRVSIPVRTREPLLIAIPVLVAVWALAGFYGSLVPMLLKVVFGLHSPLLGGLSLFVLAASAGIAVLTLQRQEAARMLILGTGMLLLGVGLIMAALPAGNIGLFFVGTAIAGIGFGTGFQGSVRTVVAHAAPHERAGVLAVIFIVSYLSMGAPAVVAGAWVAGHGGILETALVFGAGVIALAGMALGVSGVRMVRSERRSVASRAG